MATITNTPGLMLITPFFYPNIGGVETHLSDLVNLLKKSHLNTYVHTYSPLTTPQIKWVSREFDNNISVYRYNWFSGNLFNIFERYPLLQFIYLTPYLLIRSFIWLLSNHQKVTTIHSHGINSAFIGILLSKIWHKKHLVSIHAVYDHLSPKLPFLVPLLNHVDTIFTLSQSSKNQLISWGITASKIKVFRYWIDTSKFTPSRSAPRQFTVLFVGRLIQKKGIYLLLKAARRLPDIKFLIVGTGPEAAKVKTLVSELPNVDFVGKINNIDLPSYYQQSSILCIPSLYPEGYGRVIMEALSSGLPVIGSNLGGIPEAIDNSVGILFKPSTPNLVNAIISIRNPVTYKKLRNNCRSFALKHFSESNSNIFLKAYGLN